MRALRWPDAFPAGDLGLLKASGETSPSRLRDTAEAWRPWRAYAAMYLWESQHPIKWRTTMNDSADCRFYVSSRAPIGELLLTWTRTH